MVSAPDDAEPAYYSISQAAAALGVSRVSIWRWINAGVLPVSRLGHRTARISRADLNRVVAERVVGGGRPQTNWSRTGDREHFVQFYEQDESLAAGVTQFIVGALNGTDAALHFATSTIWLSGAAHYYLVEQHRAGPAPA